jgi:hypothetical protein
MKVYLAGCQGRPYVFDDIQNTDVCVLESFYYIQDWMLPYIKNQWFFLLDSGAFTFMQQKTRSVDWVEYTDRYAEFINENDIKLFFELDIDAIVGLPTVEKLRKRLESKTGKQSIPVLHRSRGKQSFLDMCKDYSYVALGGIVTKEFEKDEYRFFRWFIDKAHENRCKIHGLGFTHIPLLTKYRFDSVDSTAWVYGNRGGFLFKWDVTKGDMIKIKTGENQKLRSKEAAIHNFNEWLKFQRYAKVNL